MNSIIETSNHGVVSFDPKTSKAFVGQRLSKVSYKTISDKENPMYGIKRDSKCVSIPMIKQESIVGNINALAPYFVEYLQTVQDKIIREKVDANVSFISNDDISIAAMIEWLDSNNESGRLTKESVGKWFDETIFESLAVVLADKLGVSDTPTDAQSKQIMAVVTNFKDKVSGLAGGKTMYEPKLCESLKKCIDMAPDGDVLKARFIGRLDKMIEASKTTVDILDLL